MRIIVFIRDPLKAAYYSDGAWTADPEGATPFQSMSAGRRFCLEHGLTGVEFVPLFEGEPKSFLGRRFGVALS